MAAGSCERRAGCWPPALPALPAPCGWKGQGRVALLACERPARRERSVHLCRPLARRPPPVGMDVSKARRRRRRRRSQRRRRPSQPRASGNGTRSSALFGGARGCAAGQWRPSDVAAAAALMRPNRVQADRCALRGRVCGRNEPLACPPRRRPAASCYRTRKFIIITQQEYSKTCHRLTMCKRSH